MAFVPWMLGLIGLGLGCLLGFTNDPWLFAFSFGPVAVGYVLVWP